jgi:hypothetical protein
MINAKLKRAVAISLVSAMAVSSLAACSSSSSKKEDDKTSTEAPKATDDSSKATDGSKPEESKDDKKERVIDFKPALAVPSTDGWDSSKKIYAYSWNDEFGNRMNYVLEKYPQFKDYYEYVNFGISGTDGEYQQKIEGLITNKDEKYPSLVAMDNDVAKYFLETDDAIALDEVGITADMYKNAYQYTIDYATVDGKVKGLTWQAAPGNVAYRASIAKKVLGTDDPVEVQKYLKDWDTFFETADKMKEAKYKMTSGPDEIKYAVWDSQTKPWVSKDNVLQLDDSVKTYFEYAKKLYSGDYTNGNAMWSDGWNASMAADGDVFCYFGCTWWLYWCLKSGKEGEANSSYGDWRVCAGPADYHWGGTYVGIMKDCPNTELAAFLLYSLTCDEDILYKIESKDLDFVNNQKVTDMVIEDGVGIPGVLGGQNPIPTWKEAAKKIDLSNASFLDATLKGYMDKASETYNGTAKDKDGNAIAAFTSVDEAIKYVKDQVKDNFKYITVE